MRVALLCLLVLLAAPTGVLATDGPPLADAGLDQRGTLDRPVYLDGTGTTDPDGTLDDYRWRVEGPSGTAVPLDCETCVRTRFVPRTLGRYTVALTVTDDAGHTATDRLYVRVGTSGAVGSVGDVAVALDGPRTATVGDTVRYRARVNVTERPAALEWRIDGRVVRTRAAAAADAAVLEYTVRERGRYRVNVTATDAAGDRATASLNTTATGTASDGVPQGPQPTVTGPRLLTGGVDSATYRLDSTDGSYVDWFLDDRRVGEGRAVAVSLTPGTHALHAVRQTSQGPVRLTFAGNETGVVVDPGPTLDVAVLHGGDALSVDARAVDPVGDLDVLALSVDGERVDTASARDDGAVRLNGTYAFAAGTHEVVVSASDARGQSARVARNVTIGDGAPTVECTETTPITWLPPVLVCEVV
ncbi:hypothetical protein GCM10009037_00160 [Halarchaeum grantii]|uniref:PKD/Chitinase domain-containing protein n=1 Tax=Halarchaeum grantii TaxID=1193105 RepID=A0A830EXW7_9EURY|nr:PKD domain-containing protein [Halarchaeum grantii]GGL20841.1 hypothetical protein GCM10009037_00160 [Halarchaeum grantii]